MSDQEPLRIGIAGLGGYAAAARAEVVRDMNSEHPFVRLVAVCDPDPAAHGSVVAELQAAGIEVHTSLPQMLRTPMEAVWLPTPIGLHRSMTEQALAAGKAVLCEKPPAGCIDDLDAMTKARDKSGRPCAIAYQDIYHPTTLALKRAILGRQIGRVKSASVVGCWPRDSKYFTRAPWAGRIRCDGAWVLDSPANNAFSHFINLALFLLGPQMHTAATPVSVEAELYRALPIENYDTASLRIVLAGEVRILALLTHACMQKVDPIVEIVGDRGMIRVLGLDSAEIATSRGTHTLSREHSRAHMIHRFTRLVRGEEDERAVATLESTRPHLMAINGASEVCCIRDVPGKFVERVHDNGAAMHGIIAIEESLVKCAREGRMLHESGRVPWSCAPRCCDLRNYRRFRGVAE
jgi:predicted dehydrogenase